MNYKVSYSNLRLCMVGEKVGYFHTWEHYSYPESGGYIIGSNPAGVYSKVLAIVEFPDKVSKIPPGKIKFIDEINNNLNEFNKNRGEQ